MRKIPRIIYQEITGPSFIALLVLTFVVFTREFGRFAELVIRDNTSASTILRIVAYLLPSILIFSIPIAFLIGTLIGFSRLSSDSEVVAMRASGISTGKMVWPVLKAVYGVFLVTLIFTAFLLPQGNWKLRQIRHEIGFQPLHSEIKPHIFNEDLPDMALYIDDINLRTSLWKGVLLVDSNTEGDKRLILSRQGEVLTSPDGSTLQLHFEDGSSYEVNPDSPEKDTRTHFKSLDVPVRLDEPSNAETMPKRAKDKNLSELLADQKGADASTRTESLVELNKRVALPLSALIFAVLAATLGMTTSRGGRGYGFVVSVVVAFTYYVLLDTGTKLAAAGVIPWLPGVWGGDILLALGAFLSFRHAHEDGHLFHSLTNRPSVARILDHYRGISDRVGKILQAIANRLTSGFWAVCSACTQLTRVVDLYMIRHFLLYLLPTLAICLGLFYLFTFFELIDDVFANHIAYSLVGNYFFYLLPSVLVLLVPISILIGTLVTFGVLDKTNQVVGFKSCGVSIYRLAIPVLLLTVGLAAGLFATQEYYLPYANQRQDKLRDIIKGRPAQTYYQPGHNWIFGEGNRLYNYVHFDPNRDVFANLSVYDVDIRSSRLLRHVYAQRAVWNASSNSWTLLNGWVRDFGSQDDPYIRFATRDLRVSEGPSYFNREVKESSKMTYSELKAYIYKLQRGGFEVDQLKTELYKKISFPLVNLVMVVLGIPFAFSMGRKGALYGIAAGVLIGIVYWGAFGVFGVLGSNGLLSPALAAWGPNILFGAGGLLLLSNVRT